MKFLIVGFGSIGRRHFQNLLSLGEKDILLLRSMKSSLNTDELKDFQVLTRLEDALSEKPDTVILANPTALHLDIAIPAARAGCHLLFEKPISDNLDRIPELMEALLQGGGQALTGFQFRFHPGLQKIHALIRSGVIGEVITARAHWGEYLPGWHPWEDYRKSYSARKDLGGGVILTLCHPIDYLRWMLGEVTSVWAHHRQSAHLEIETEAAADIGMEFAGGVYANVHLNYIQSPSRHNLEIIGDQGTIWWDNSDGIVHCFERSTKESKQFEPPPGFERNTLFIAEMQHFIDIANRRAEPICTLQDGIAVQKIVDAAYCSAQKREFISLT